MTHNTTAATRLLDTLELVAIDPRVRIFFTRTGSSVFDTDTQELFAARGVTEISWPHALSTEFDLAISASYGGELHDIQAPLIVIPHGMGYNKYLNKEQRTKNKEQRTKNKEQRTKNKEQRTKNKEQSVFGLSPEWIMHNGRVVPDVIVLSHPEQRERLKDTCPEAVPNTLLAGDICYDRLRASTLLRPSYRRAYGLDTGQRLIVVSTTWGPDSLLGINPDFPRKLASTLPVDKFRIVLCLHPNIRSHHSRWQVAEYLSGAARAGIEISEGVGDWRTAVVAADLILGDHGSIPYYSTSLGNPLLLAAAPTHSVDPASPSAQLLRAAPNLDLNGDIGRQIEQTIAEHDVDRYSGIAALTSSSPDAGAKLLRAALYRIMRLPEPDEPAEISALPLPAHPLAGPSSHVVHVRLDTDRAATITRFPAERLHTDLPNGADTHLAVGVVDPRRGWLQSADILIGEPGADTDRWITDSLARLPGCALATAPDSSGDWLLGDKNILVRVTGPAPAPRLFASLAYHLLCHGQRLDKLTGPWTIQCAERTFTITVAALKRSGHPTQAAQHEV